MRKYIRKTMPMLALCACFVNVGYSIASDEVFNGAPRFSPSPNAGSNDYSAEVIKLRQQAEAFDLFSRIKQCEHNRIKAFAEVKRAAARRLVIFGGRLSPEEESKFTKLREDSLESCKNTEAENLRLLQAKLERAEHAESERLSKELASFNYKKRVGECYNRLESALELDPKYSTDKLKHHLQWKQMAMLQCQTVEDINLKVLKDRSEFAESVVKNRKNYYQDQMACAESLTRARKH